MAKKFGRCKNYGQCHYADDRKVLEADEQSFICSNPECRKPLVPIGPPPSPSRPVGRIVLTALLVLVIGVAMIYYGTMFPEPVPPPPGPIPTSSPPPSEPQTKPVDEWLKQFPIDR